AIEVGGHETLRNALRRVRRHAAGSEQCGDECAQALRGEGLRALRAHTHLADFLRRACAAFCPSASEAETFSSVRAMCARLSSIVRSMSRLSAARISCLCS